MVGIIIEVQVRDPKRQNGTWLWRWVDRDISPREDMKYISSKNCFTYPKYGLMINCFPNDSLFPTKSLQMVIAAMKLKDVYYLEGKL